MNPRASSRSAAQRGATGRAAAGTWLLLDVGNSRLKWGRWQAGRLADEGSVPRALWARGTRARAALARLGPVARVLVASVAAPSFNADLARAVRAVLGCTPEFVATAPRAAGVVNAYAEPWRLGVDRWVAAIAGHSLFRPPRHVCIVDIGTALTVDLVDARGRHRGGVIVPGPELMVSSLLAGTSGIRRRAAGRGAPARSAAFARNTRAALESGARHAAAATIDRFAAEARAELGRGVQLILTGGAAEKVASLVRSRYRMVPDLVLRGLAVIAARPR